MSETQQPEILETQWDRGQVDTLFDDLQRGAKIQHIQVRTSTGGRPQDRQTTLEEARQLLDSAEAKAIQIRYTFEQEDWCDTLMVLPDSIRIIRTRAIVGG